MVKKRDYYNFTNAEFDVLPNHGNCTHFLFSHKVHFDVVRKKGTQFKTQMGVIR